MNNLRLVSTRFIPQLGKTSISNFGRIPSLILRQYSQSSSVFGFEEFYDVPLKKNEVFVVGREWTVADLRRKSFEDLHKLWYILYKERNLLLTAKHERASFSQREPTLEENRYRRVKLSMANIKRVIEERKKIDKFFKQQEEKNSQSTLTTNTTSTKEDTTN